MNNTRSNTGVALVRGKTSFGVPFIRKIISYENPEEKERGFREIKLVRGLRTSYFVPLLSYTEEQDRIIIEYEEYDMSLTEFLQNKLKRTEFLSELGAILVFTTILKGIYSLHQLNMIHRNIDSSSIYIKNNGEIGIGGLHRIRELSAKDRPNNMEYVSRYANQSPFEAPELQLGSYTQNVDIFSLGCILYELSTKITITKQLIGNFYVTSRIDFYDGFPYHPYFEQLLYKMISKSPPRINSHDLMNDPFVLQCLLLCRDKKLMKDGTINSEMICTRKRNVKIPPVIKTILTSDSPEEMCERLGEGSFGEVFRCIKGDVCLVKKNILKRPYQKAGLDYEEETRHCHNLYHDNIITTLVHLGYDDEFFYYIYMEECTGGDLSQLIEKMNEDGQRFSATGVYKIFCSVLNGLYHIHKHNLIHRDLKPENLLISKDGSIILSDLGIMIEKKEGDDLAGKFAGSFYYASPEMLEGKSFDQKTDIFSLGRMMAEICGEDLDDPRHHLFSDRDFQCQLNAPYDSFPDLEGIINSMLVTEPNDRISTDEIMDNNTIITNNYQTKQIPFFENNCLCDSMKNNISTPSSDKVDITIEYNLFKIYNSEEKCPNINKLVADPSITIEDIYIVAPYLFPEVDTYNSQAQKYGHDLNDYVNACKFFNIIDKFLQYLGFKSIIKSSQFALTEVSTSWSWGKQASVLNSITNMLKILRLYFDSVKVNNNTIQNRMNGIFITLVRLAKNHPGSFPYANDNVSQWMNAICADDAQYKSKLESLLIKLNQ